MAAHVRVRAGLALVEALRLITLSAVLAQIAPVHGQDYPSRTIKLVVPSGPGGPTDASARLVAQIAQSELGQTVLVENRPEDHGAYGSDTVANADPDGYTLLVGTSATLGIVPAVTGAGYDPIKSFTPVAEISDSTLALVVPNSFPANTVQDLVAYARAHPGQLGYASAGVGDQSQVLAELFKARAGLNIVDVPCHGDAALTAAITSGRVQLAFSDLATLLPLIRAGRVKALAVTSAVRHPQLPDIPTMAESGISDFVLMSWSGVVAPAGTPASVVDKLNGAINKALGSRSAEEILKPT
ncbi:MAG: tripartite tricarboxylate transporter substrate binding protein, partial [Bradyrhizobiaceae bacterium]|nr:tripartite tricarboxylate transporter substrate binding protein [Bradyrhizobiaceae bacterium]